METERATQENQAVRRPRFLQDKLELRTLEDKCRREIAQLEMKLQVMHIHEGRNPGGDRVVMRMLKDSCKSKRAELEVVMEKRAQEGLAAHRLIWEQSYAEFFGSFEDTTIVPAMRFTFESFPVYAAPDDTLQIFSVKIAQLENESYWPLQVYGSIAIRDSMDPRRNLIFQRDRSNCQIITKEEPFLLLTGPSRGVVLLDPAVFVVELKTKGKTESSEDISLAVGALRTQHAGGYSSRLPGTFTFTYCGIRSKLEFTQALLEHSVEATIMVELVEGSWPESIPGRVAAYTVSIPDDIVLLDSRDGGMSFNDYDVLKLSRRVVSVELSGMLGVKVMSYHPDGVLGTQSILFKPKKSATSYQRCDMKFCILGITVAWSVFSPCL